MSKLTHTSKSIAGQLDLYEDRAKNLDLKWCTQVFNLVDLNNDLSETNILKINDIGCNYFQFYKELKLRKLNFKYFGYDIDDKFIKLGLTKFPELKTKHKIGNCENIKLLKTDFSIMSAVLEHVDNPIKLLNKVVSTTKKIVCIRTFLGVKSHNIINKNGLNQILPYNINQFSFKTIEDKLKKYGFKSFFILDKATSNSTKFKLVNNKFKRHMYIVIGIKD